MHPEAEAEVALNQGAQISASPVASWGFICTFGSEAFSAAVVLDGTAHLKLGQPHRIRLKFLVPAATQYAKPGATFTFFEGGRTGVGRIL
jgi:hypothetical protein